MIKSFSGQVFFSVPEPYLLTLDKSDYPSIVMLHIKLKGMDHRAPCKHIFCPYKHSQPQGGRMFKIVLFFLKIVILHIKLKQIWCIEHHARTYSVLTNILNLWGRIKRSKQILIAAMLHIKLKEKKYSPT